MPLGFSITTKANLLAGKYTFSYFLRESATRGPIAPYMGPRGGDWGRRGGQYLHGGIVLPSGYDTFSLRRQKECSEAAGTPFNVRGQKKGVDESHFLFVIFDVVTVMVAKDKEERG